MTHASEPVAEPGSADQTAEPIAIIGMACRLPGAADVGEYWRNLMDGVESVRALSREEMRAAGAPDEELDDPALVPVLSTMDQAEHFDAGMFGMTARQAEITDPQHRLFLELCHTALETAGYDAARYPGDVGVYGGVGPQRYLRDHLLANRRIAETTGSIGLGTANYPDYVTTLASYRLNLTGPSVNVHTACSTALVAVHTACEALRGGECEMALAGGVMIEFPRGRGYLHMEGGTDSIDGHCRPFDAGASGTVWASGGAIVLLKRLADAVADGDHVHAVVLGNAINNDGATKIGFTAPSVEGQSAAIANALAVAGVDGRDITLVEAHGTGTVLGDPIEITALSAVYGRDTEDRGWCAVGSVKSNLGHLSQGAGTAGLIKAALALEHGLIPPTLNFSSPNPAIDFTDSPFYVPTTLSKWERNGRPRRAAVSSLGMGGTNAHVILGEAPPRAARPAAPARDRHLLQVSARSEQAVAAAVERLADHLAGHPELELADVAFTLATGRHGHRHRVAVVARDTADAVTALRTTKRHLVGTADTPPPVAFLFSGQGSQYPGMAADLCRTEPVFAGAVEECLGVLGGRLGAELATLLRERDADTDRLQRTEYTQPALFTVEYALARLWLSRGVAPDAMIGHSIGEYVAATIAGVFTLPDALRLVALRGRLMQSMPAGAMLAVQHAEDAIADRLPGELCIATVNGPGTCVVAGPTDIVERFAAELTADDIGSTRLRTSHAFHSAMMDPILTEFTTAVAGVPREAPTRPFLSNLTGDWITAEQATDPTYWARHLRQAVRFDDCVATLLATDGSWAFLEVGPGRQLAGLVRLPTPARGGKDATQKALVVPSLPAATEKTGAVETFDTATGRLWGAGIEVENPSTKAHRVPLPPYPYERTRHWIDPDPIDERDRPAMPITKRPGVEDWFSAPVWRQLPPTPPSPRQFGRCLVFVPWPASDDLAGSILAGVTAGGGEVVVVRPGDTWSHEDEGFRIRPTEPEDYHALVQALADSGGGVPTQVIHAWALSGEPAANDPAATRAAQDLGYFSALHLVQALAGRAGGDQAGGDAAGDGATQGGGFRVDIVTAGTRDVVGGDLTRPEHATMDGLVLTAARELSTVAVRHIDCADGTVAGQAAEELLAELLAELARTADREESGETAVALRRGRRWVRGFDTVRVPAPAGGTDRPPLRAGGVYLITGGYGGLGLAVAEHIAASTADASLVLMGRSGLPPRAEWDDAAAGDQGAARVGGAVAAIRRMEAAGARVLPLAGDISDAAALAAVRTAVMERFGRLDGIVHAAGVASGAMIEAETRTATARVMTPKVFGLLALYQVFGDLKLDFVSLFSSLTAVLGGLGDVSYAAANAYLDAYAASPHGWRAPVRSLNWGAWLEVGMAAESADRKMLERLRRDDPDSAAEDAAEDAADEVPESPSQPIDHPVLSTLHPATGDTPGYCRGVVSPRTDWLLDEHRIGDAPVMVGTGQLEIIRAAVAAIVPRPDDRHVIELRDVVFVEPLAVGDHTTAEIRIVVTPDPTPGEDSVDVEVLTVIDGERRSHTRCAAGWVLAPPGPTTDLAAATGRCTAMADVPGFAARYLTDGVIRFGPRWYALAEVWLGAGEELLRITAPSEASADYDSWPLHPAMLDVATLVVGEDVGKTATSVTLPIGYGRVLIRDRIPTDAWVHRRYREAQSADVYSSDFVVVDGAGTEVVAVTDFMLRSVDHAVIAPRLANPAEHPHPGAPKPAAGIGKPVDQSTVLQIPVSQGVDAFLRSLTTGLGTQLLINPLPYESALRRSIEGAAQIMARLRGDTGVDARRDSSSGGPLTDLVAPRTDTEATLVDVWATVLGVTAIGVEDSFFELGGNSLVAVQLIAQIRRTFGVRLPMRDLFDAPTVAGMAVHVDRLRAADAAPAADQPTSQTIPRVARAPH